MNCYATTVDRMAWDIICTEIAKRQYCYSFGHYCIPMQSRGYGKIMTSRALFRSIINNFSDDFDKNSISIRWCEYFEIPNFRGRKNYIVHMAKIERYILPKTRFRR